MIKAVIFDFDGTLADTEPFHSAKRAEMLDELGVTADNDFVGISLRTFWGGIVKSYKGRRPLSSLSCWRQTSAVATIRVS